jgi:DNA-binding transcriptional regulator LsrR (DeoR family)
MDEVTLYNLHGASASARYAAEDAQTLALELMVKHLRFEHGMTNQDIAKRLGLKAKQVKNILG